MCDSESNHGVCVVIVSLMVCVCVVIVLPGCLGAWGVCSGSPPQPVSFLADLKSETQRRRVKVGSDQRGAWRSVCWGPAAISLLGEELNH